MPELPEVETIRRQLTPYWVGRRISQVATTRPSYFFLTSPARLRRALAGRGLESLERHGKYLISELDDGSRLLFHLGMTGQLFLADLSDDPLHQGASSSSDVLPAKEPEEPSRPSPGAASQRASASGKSGSRSGNPSADQHTHLRLSFEDSLPDIHFRDVRKFGKVHWLAKGEETERLDKLGPDALQVSAELLYRASRGRKLAIKAMLLDQSVLAGVGNIYADESLFHARIHPTRSASSIQRKEYQRLSDALSWVLHQAIALGGSTIRDYRNVAGEAGAFQGEWAVYGRAGQKCLVCETAICQVRVAQRGTHFCETCQG